jgi:hypothetical protein
LGYTNTVEAGGLPLSHRVKLRQLGYIPPGGTDWSTYVIITEYSGAASQEEVRASRDEHASRQGSTEYGELEFLAIGGRDGWGWLETRRDQQQVTSLGYTGIVPWGTLTYSIEVSTHDPRLQEPGYLRDVTMSFTVLKQATYDAWIMIIGGVILGAILYFALRASRAGAPRQDTLDRLLHR